MAFNEDQFPNEGLGKVVQISSGRLNSCDATPNGKYPFFTCGQEILRINKYEQDKEAVLLGGNNRTATFSLFYYNGKFTARQRVYIISSIDISILVNKFLYLALQHRMPTLSPAARGTTTQFITLPMLNELTIPLPDRDTQQQIVDFVWALNDRITLLRETNATLNAIAQSLFKSWFVDFDPVKAKVDGRDPEGIPLKVAELFPSEFEDSDLGKIPKGWNITQVKELCSSIFNGGTPSRANYSFWESGTIDWFKTGELADGFLLSSTERITDAGLSGSAARVLPRHSVLMAIYAAPTVGRLGILSKPATFNQACTGLVPKPEVGPWFLFQTLLAGRAWFNNRANGAAQQNISKVIVESYPTIMPSTDVLSVFNDNVDGIYRSIEHNARSISTIIEIRDTLLPRLMSGKLCIPDAQEITA